MGRQQQWLWQTVAVNWGQRPRDEWRWQVVPDPNLLAEPGGGDRLPLLTVVYFTASLPTSTAVFAGSGNGLDDNAMMGMAASGR
jgi:hypothetical protein